VGFAGLREMARGLGKDKEREEGFIGFSCGEDALGASLWLFALLLVFWRSRCSYFGVLDVLTLPEF
jgi:hypothetical protein